MKAQSNPSLQRLVALGALALLAATVSGCGVGLPTQPDINQGTVIERSAGDLALQESGGPFELGDPSMPGGGSGPTSDPTGEIVIPPAPGPTVGGGGWAYGHLKNKWKSRP